MLCFKHSTKEMKPVGITRVIRTGVIRIRVIRIRVIGIIVIVISVIRIKVGQTPASARDPLVAPFPAVDC
jgi:hypothetical protein